MAPAPNPGPPVHVAAAGLASVGIWRLLAVAAPHLAALAVMLQTETDLGSPTRFLPAWGDPELPLDRTAAAAGAVRRAVADAGRGADPVVAAQARHRADDRELRRPDGDRPRYRGVSLYDLSQPALVRHRRSLRPAAPDVCAVVARSIPDPPPAGARLHAGLSCCAGRIFLRMAR